MSINDLCTSPTFKNKDLFNKVIFTWTLTSEVTVTEMFTLLFISALNTITSITRCICYITFLQVSKTRVSRSLLGWGHGPTDKRKEAMNTIF